MKTTPRAKVVLALSMWVVALGACTSDPFDLELGSETQAAGTFPPVTSFSAPGPFAVTQQSLGSSCTMFRPTVLGQNGVTHPVILWGNGTFSSPSTYAELLRHLASHGFIVAAANTSNAGNGSQMITCLNNAIAGNASASSVLFQRVDTARVGASGHSQGGAGTIMAGRDARVGTTAPLEPYIGFIFGGGRFLTSSIGQQRGPMFLVSGSADTIAVPSTHQQPVFNGINQPVFWATRIGADHFEPTGNAGDFRGPVTAWFRARLMDDASAAAVFANPCTLCSTPGWTIRQR